MDKLNVEIELHKVQKIKFSLHTGTHDNEQVSYYDFRCPVDGDYVHECLEDWANQFYGWYSRYKLEWETVGMPFVQKTIFIPVSELEKMFELTEDEKITSVRIVSGTVLFVIGVNEPNENPYS